DPPDAEAAAQPVDDRDQGGHVGGVAGPQLAADRPPPAVEHHTDDHLVQVRPVVLAVAPLADLLAAVALEVERGGVEEHQLQAGEGVPAGGEQAPLDPVLGAAGGERRLVLLLVVGQLLAEPGHGPVEVVQLQGLAALDLVVRLPLVGSPVAAGGEQPVEDREEDGPLDVEPEAAAVQQVLDDPSPTGLQPQPLEDQGRTDAAGGDGGQLPLDVSGEQQDGPGEASPGGQQGIESAGLPELIEAPQGGEDPLTGAPALPAVLDDLEVGA